MPRRPSSGSTPHHRRPERPRGGDGRRRRLRRRLGERRPGRRNYGVYARRYNAAGVPQGGEFRVNTYTTGNQSLPAVGHGRRRRLRRRLGEQRPGRQRLRHLRPALQPPAWPRAASSRSTRTPTQPATPRRGHDGDGDFVVAWHGVPRTAALPASTPGGSTRPAAGRPSSGSTPSPPARRSPPPW